MKVVLEIQILIIEMIKKMLSYVFILLDLLIKNTKLDTLIKLFLFPLVFLHYSVSALFNCTIL